MGLDLTELDPPSGASVWYRLGLTHLLGLEPDPLKRDPLSDGHSFPDLPEPWLKISKEHTAPCATLWTYWQLACDLGDEASPPRTQLFQKIVNALGWSPSDIVFWPAADYRATGLHLRSKCFWAGLALFQPVYVFIFGHPAFSRLFPQKEGRQYGLFIQDQIKYIFLPGPEDMLPDQKQAKSFVWNTLKDIQLKSR